MTNITKTCSKCNETKPLDEFNKNKNGKYKRQAYCKKCNFEYRENHKEENKEYQKEWYEKNGYLSMYENKSCSSYLGIVVGERLCRYMFKDVEVMPHNNTGNDIVCNKSKKIDVKSACVTSTNDKYPRWAFKINLNTTADYFILVAFDNRTNLNPIHLWMIPGKEVNQKESISISPSTLHKWDKWKRDINNAQICCTEMKQNNNWR